MVDFYVQLSENTDEEKLMDIFKQTLQASNYSLGGTELYAAKETGNLNAEGLKIFLSIPFLANSFPQIIFVSLYYRF